MRLDSRAAIPVALIGQFACVASAQAQSFDVPAGPLGIVVGRIGQQAGITIIVTDAELADRRSPGVRGRVGVRRALVRALAGTGATAVFHDAKLVRVIRAARRPPRRSKPRPAPPPVRTDPPDEVPPEIIVTASKQRSALDRYPGSAKVVDMDAGWTAQFGTDGLSALTKLVPAISSTNLGIGREKIFIRGVADSSFTGPTQAATGQYFGDVRLTYNAPDPALNMYDMQRMEVLVGPQAPLYGAGSLGGVIRLVPRMPDVNELLASGSLTVAATRRGAPGSQGAAMLNLPVESGRWGLRAVVSADQLGGYIDDPVRGLSDINRSRLQGHRVALRGSDLSGWTIDVGHVGQSIRTDTGQYVLAGSPDLTRDEPYPQPFSSLYGLAYLNASRSIGSMELVTTNSRVRHRLDSTADASAIADVPLLVRVRNGISILSHETRVSGGSSRAPWVVGVSAIRSGSKVFSELRVPDAAPLRVTFVNNNLDAAIYGQVTRPITATLTGTVGARVTYARTESYVSDLVSLGVPHSIRNAARFTRTVGLDWRPGGPVSGFFRHDQGYRPGGLTAIPTIVGLASQSYRPDTLDMYEFGIRAGDMERSFLALRATIFYGLWNDVQADMVDANGLAFTDNVGEGRINGLDIEMRMRFPSVLMTAAAFFNDSRLNETSSETVARDSQSLPNVASSGGRLAINWNREVSSSWTLNAHAAVRYVGRSRLGVGSVLDIRQGDYGVADAGVRLSNGSLSLSANIENVADTRGNTFASGNPFTVARRDQITPLRPRTLRLTAEVAF